MNPGLSSHIIFKVNVHFCSPSLTSSPVAVFVVCIHIRPGSTRHSQKWHHELQLRNTLEKAEDTLDDNMQEFEQREGMVEEVNVLQSRQLFLFEAG